MPRSRTYPIEIRERARSLRQVGWTYTEIIAELGEDIPKNTLHYWVRDITLTDEQQERIRQKEREARAAGRPLAAEWHREQKRLRLQAAEEWAEPLATRLSTDREALLLMLAALWLGEGYKRDDVLMFGNSDPRIIKGWVEILRSTFEIDESKFACQLYLSEGMPEQEYQAYWSSITGIPLDKFQKSGFKKAEAVGKIRREGYKGVCKVIYHSAELRRQIGALGWQLLARFDDSEKSM